MIYKQDGAVERVRANEILPGMILRMIHEDDFHPSFDDCIVKKVEGDTVYLARPYCYASLTETICPSILTGVEEFTVSIEGCCKRFYMVMMSTGKPDCRRT